MYRNVDIVRLEADEPDSTFVEAGDRAAASVFPNESKKLKRVDAATIEAALGMLQRSGLCSIGSECGCILKPPRLHLVLASRYSSLMNH